MTIHGQTLGVFKRDNNQCIDTGATTTLTKIKIVVFLGVYGAMTRFSPRNTSLWRHYNVFHDEKRPLWLLVISYAINFLLVRCDWWLSIKVSIWARAWPHRNIFRIPWPVFRIPHPRRPDSIRILSRFSDSTGKRFPRLWNLDSLTSSFDQESTLWQRGKRPV